MEDDELFAYLNYDEDGEEQLVFEAMKRDEVDWLKNLWKLPSADEPQIDLGAQ